MSDYPKEFWKMVEGRHEKWEWPLLAKVFGFLLPHRKPERPAPPTKPTASCMVCGGKKFLEKSRAYADPILSPYGYKQDQESGEVPPEGAVLFRKATELCKYNFYRWKIPCGYCKKS